MQFLAIKLLLNFTLFLVIFLPRCVYSSRSYDALKSQSIYTNSKYFIFVGNMLSHGNARRKPSHLMERCVLLSSLKMAGITKKSQLVWECRNQPPKFILSMLKPLKAPLNHKRIASLLEVAEAIFSTIGAAVSSNVDS